MRSLGKHLLVILAILITGVPAAFIITILLLPLWSWIEATYAIESVGHSGPADWCFWLVYSVWFVVLSGGWYLRSRLMAGNVEGQKSDEKDMGSTAGR